MFHYLTYEGAVDVASIADKRHRAALEVQINEFGQCPRQIFSTPHPSRLVCPSSTEALAIAREAIAGRLQARQGILDQPKVLVCTLTAKQGIVGREGWSRISKW